MIRTIWIIALALLGAGCDRIQQKFISPQTELFRSDWTNGQRAKVTADLIPLLKVGMTKDQVSTILERPSRLNDGLSQDGDSETWTFTITLGRILILTFKGNELIKIDGG